MGGSVRRTIGQRRRLDRAVLLASLTCLASVGAAGSVPDPDVARCASCHFEQTGRHAATGGHSALLECESCHVDRRPGRVGARHRAVARCSDCHEAHEAQGHPPRTRGSARRATRNCVACHDPHGSTNRDLVRTDLRWRRRILDVAFTSGAGAEPGGFTDPAAPGSGLCEACHRKTEFFRRDGAGAPHFTEPCTLCHRHEAGFGIVVAEGNCAVCHADQAARRAGKPSAHSTLQCGRCHAELAPAPGPGHRAEAACGSCHQDTAAHAPGGNAIPCAQCHEPHGTDNTHLVRDLLTTTQGAQVPIRFDNLFGRVDASFASASAPGTGVCEVCHTTTRFYRADGGGEDHFDFSCLPCHRHAGGFAPQ